jgi:hypothetical protein
MCAESYQTNRVTTEKGPWPNDFKIVWNPRFSLLTEISNNLNTGEIKEKWFAHPETRIHKRTRINSFN